MYQWKESDSYFFDEQARSLAAGDWLIRAPMHPYHGWHQEFADTYFKNHPDVLNRIVTANPGRDSSFVPGKVLWNEWYGGNRYHQEPLYVYLLAVLYALTGNGVYWMIILQLLAGVMSGILLWIITRRFFDDNTAFLAAVLYTFCGIALFQEALILRTSWSVFFALLTIYMFQLALDKNTKPAFLMAGLAIGLAYILQSFFVLFLIGAIGIYGIRARKMSAAFAANAAIMIGGFLLVCVPVFVRNAAVGAPVFSIASTGAITFVATNVSGTNAVSRWQPEAAKCANIMGNSNGKFLPAALASIGGHTFGLVWAKLASAINGTEWPNNENYYFYREIVPVLKVTFLNFYWIAALGIAGLLFSLYYKNQRSTLYLGILVQVAILLGFYVLGRLRVPLAVMMLPFAAYGLTACLRFAENGWAKIGVLALCVFISFQFYPPEIATLDRTDYNALYEVAFIDRIKASAESKNAAEALAIHGEFLKYEPRFIKEIKPGKLLKTASEVALLDYFANHHQIHSFLYEDSGNRQMAATEMQKFQNMKMIVENSRRNSGR